MLIEERLDVGKRKVESQEMDCAVSPVDELRELGEGHVKNEGTHLGENHVRL